MEAKPIAGWTRFSLRHCYLQILKVLNSKSMHTRVKVLPFFQFSNGRSSMVYEILKSILLHHLNMFYCSRLSVMFGESVRQLNRNFI